MQTDLRGRDLIGDLDFSKEEVETVLDVAFDLKRKRALGESHAYLRDKVLAMLFFFSSTRTRGSFEAGMAQLGGHAAFIESKTTQIAHGDTPKEIGEIFGRYFDGIAIRHVDWGIGNGYLNAVAKNSRVPILNMQCDIYHPFQILADLMTIIEKKGRDLRRKKMVVSWAYAASYQKPMSVPQSLVLQMPRFGMDVVLAHPPEFRLMPEIMDRRKSRRGNSAPASRWWMIWKLHSRMRISFTPNPGAPWCTPRMPKKGRRSSRSMKAGSPMSARWRSPNQMPSTCTPCLQTGTSRLRMLSSTALSP